MTSPSLPTPNTGTQRSTSTHRSNGTQRSTSTWRTNSSSSSSASSTALRYNLDEDSTTPILAYTYGGDITTTSQKSLCQALDQALLDGQDPSSNSNTIRRQRVTRKEIPRFASALDVRRHDLYLPDEHDEFRKYPNYDSSLASIRLPSAVYWGRALFGRYDSLYIVSPETSPESSEAGSFDGCPGGGDGATSSV